MVRTVRSVLKLVGPRRRRVWLGLALFAMVVSVLEMAGAAAVFVLLALVADPSGDAELPVVGTTVGAGSEDGSLFGAVLAIGAFFAFRSAVQLVFAYAKHRTAQNDGAALSTRLADGYLRVPYSFHLHREPALTVQNAHMTPEHLAGQCFLQIVQLVSEVFLTAALLVVMLVVAPIGTGIAVVVVGGTALLLLRVVQPRMQSLGSDALHFRVRGLAVLQEALQGLRDIKILRAENHISDDYHDGRRRLARSMYHYGWLSELPRHIVELALMSCVLAMFALSVVADSEPKLLLSTVGLFAYVGLRLLPSLQKMVAAANNIRFASAAVEIIQSDLKEIERVGRDMDASGEFTFNSEFRLAGVGHTYHGAASPSLHDVDLVIRPGEAIGVVGPTGGGKTTLIDVICGLVDPQVGSVTVDGRPLREHRLAWFGKLGLVPQMTFISDDTIRNNIAFGCPRDAIDEAAVAEAVNLAQLDEFIGGLPEGLDSRVGDRGVRVSGGQRQRIAIARALYRRPEILVLDEGTSALDGATEAALMDSLDAMRGSHTLILVAHRLATVRACDRLVYIVNGEVDGLGTYDELRANNAGFRSLVGHALREDPAHSP